MVKYILTMPKFAPSLPKYMPELNDKNRNLYFGTRFYRKFWFHGGEINKRAGSSKKWGDSNLNSSYFVE